MIKVSIIIPAYNAAETIKDLLYSLIKQNFPKKDYEVIVVDDGSKDNSKFKMQNAKWQFKIQNLRSVEGKHRGAGAARNTGAQKARGEILVFIDSDCLAPKNWLKHHYQAQQKSKEPVIIGGGVKKPRETSFLAWADYFSSWHNAHEDLKKQQTEYVPSLNMSIKRKTFNQLKGFWEKGLTGEDVDFCFRARQKGVKIFFDPQMAVWHQRPSLKRFFKHNFNWGYHAPFVRGKHNQLRYHSLFVGNFLKAFFFTPLIVFGWILFLTFSWWCYQPLRFLVCLPLVFFGRLTYGFGFLAGSWQKSFN